MAPRWRLMSKHYLNVPGTEWEYVEISRATGKQARVRYPVPLFLNPEDPADHNYPGEIIVAHKSEEPKGEKSRFHTLGSKDIIFTGEPTPEMEPLNEEAEKISKSLEHKWIHAIESLPANGDNYNQSLLTKLESELTQAIQRVGGVPKGFSNTPIKFEDFELLKKQVSELSKQNAALLARLTEKPETVEKK